ncbi:long-chain acyl-CoA synthetase [Saccharopolyspora erythraea NRRL 2338]|uniref:Acyl-CoA synthetase n=1 Tax=Saccharopolyspora erythraea TaxID=1836 RepID=A0ABN1CEB5_SACER|nr:AMP-dependent synthetase/ligase [Saccharopolyspora erythraea]EQD82358.1 AMP-dependent synthetase [Saccharopolyspora erythraea D]PFG96473.1 long-chain acyl-CoA synthetase [Saccharopolyspora erythraea NRRL 2338]QRK92967.1 long-chain fatty acid--CoA ligase [Saccharopolyspora erythraea]
MPAAERVRKAVEGHTIPGLLRRNARQFADLPALTAGTGAEATTLTWAGLREEVAALARGLAGLGLRRGDRMLISMSHRPEHWVADLAAAHVGAVSCTTYDTLSSEQLRFLAEHSAAAVVVVEGPQQWDRWRPVIDDLPSLRAIVVLDEQIIPDGDERFAGYAALRGGGADPDFAAEFEELTDAATPDAPLSMVYTSGTTGEPKGVVLSHRNVIHESLTLDELAPLPEHPRSVSYLPLAHIAERVLGIYRPICGAGHVTICAGQAELVPTLVAARPHSFFGVPRVWEKLAAGLQAKLDALPSGQRAALDEARELSLRVLRQRGRGAEVPAELEARRKELDEALLLPIRAAIGLDAALRSYSGAAPIPIAVLELLAGIGLPVYEVWGLSETSGASTVTNGDTFTLGAVGRALPGIEVATAEDGELLVRGPVVFLGYLRPDGGVEDGTDEDGWFHTGDIGVVDERGVVTITDRKKELIITAGGKNIAPAKVEAMLRAHPLVAQAVAVGDRRPYLTALVVLDEEAAPAWAEAHGIGTVDLAELACHPDVLAELDALVDQANQVLARVEQIKKYRVLPHPWTAESGELTPKLSLRRRVVAERYAAEIDRMYA